MSLNQSYCYEAMGMDFETTKSQEGVHTVQERKKDSNASVTRCENIEGTGPTITNAKHIRVAYQVHKECTVLCVNLG